MASKKQEGYIIGVAIGMEYVEGKMHIATSWTTAACLQGGAVIATAYAPTTSDVFDGFKQVLRDVLKRINPGKQ